MTITMNDSRMHTIPELVPFLQSGSSVEFAGVKQEEMYDWITNILRKFGYQKLKKKERGVVRKYIQKITGYSKAQMNRLILQYTENGKIEKIAYQRHVFSTQYTECDIRLLAEIDELYQYPNGASIKKSLERMVVKYGCKEYEQISKISVGHIYNLRRSSTYLRITKRYEKTKPNGVSIGIRSKPRPGGKPGYIRVDTVHQGDSESGGKGVYHINMVDEVTQFEFTGAVEQISEAYLIPLLKKLIEACPILIIEFHSDNGSEYINHHVAKLLSSLVIKLTKSRSRHSQDNALVEGKNNALIRNWMGYGFIDRKYAKDINTFYFEYFHEFMNYHRACAFPEEIADPKKAGKTKKVYPSKGYMTPYEKLKSLNNAKQYLKPEITFEHLDAIAHRKSDLQMAQEVQTNRYKLFTTIFNSSL
jgi:hypothetical protein